MGSRDKPVQANAGGKQKTSSRTGVSFTNAAFCATKSLLDLLGVLEFAHVLIVVCQSLERSRLSALSFVRG